MSRGFRKIRENIFGGIENHLSIMSIFPEYINTLNSAIGKFFKIVGFDITEKYFFYAYILNLLNFGNPREENKHNYYASQCGY